MRTRKSHTPGKSTFRRPSETRGIDELLDAITLSGKIPPKDVTEDLPPRDMLSQKSYPSTRPAQVTEGYHRDVGYFEVWNE